MNQDFSSDEVLTEIRGSLGIITLNRPKALNALNIDMIRQILAVLKSWEEDAGIKAVLFLGAGERAFSSGGDIKNFYRVGMNYRRGSISLNVASMFFAEEYSLDWRIFHYPKPTISFMDGITMGGGFGIAGNCANRIVTERMVFAMPETGIGFFPDVGSIYHLLRAPDNWGRYLAVTASSIGGKDMMLAGLADYFVDTGGKKDLIAALSEAKNYKQTIESFNATPTGESLFEKNGGRIARLFLSDDVRKIKKALAEDGTPFALETLDLIESRSPTSVLVAAEHLHRSRGRDFDTVIAQDFILTQRFLERNDFYEGIRAAVIDKDRNPVWQPAYIEDVSPRDVTSYFEPTGHELQDVTFFRPLGPRK